MDGEVIIPDSIEPYVGWKALRIRVDGQLESPQQGTIWPVKQRLEAVCNKDMNSWGWVPVEGDPCDAIGPYIDSGTDFVPIAEGTLKRPTPRPNNPLPKGWYWSWQQMTHDVPDDDCQCGCYVVDSPKQCDSYMKPDTVLCLIAVWGRTITANRGARGQYAYPQTMVIPYHLADVGPYVADLYGIESYAFSPPPGYVHPTLERREIRSPRSESALVVTDKPPLGWSVRYMTPDEMLPLLERITIRP